jgi:hypothetical protein
MRPRIQLSFLSDYDDVALPALSWTLTRKSLAFETELPVTDLLVTEFSPTTIATAASPAVTHMTARRIEVYLEPLRAIGCVAHYWQALAVHR